MSIEILREFLGWSVLINAGLILVWWGFFLYAHDFVYRVHTRWFKLSPERFDAVHHTGISLYATVIGAFFIIPWVALHIIA